ncbi:alcohol dehydrogenase 2-like [Orussus abietinus]|uniref:alcohol dehydrogenase 2-like n=1 Tax=Orussus abietinus TaxID=222816 RepID=UPI000C71600D|nr:alcohol dehydrogenase 2-like [Orussus abietinus]
MAKPILEPMCKIAVVLGGATGVGYAAANHLLMKGARSVVLIDSREDTGHLAARKLCSAFGKDRAQYLRCDTRVESQLEGILGKVLCKHKGIHILFNDLDKHEGRRPPRAFCSKEDSNLDNTTRAVQTGMKFMGTPNGGPGGMIVNSASILGFMAFPQDPVPVYCFKEPAIEATRDLAKQFPEEKTGVRIVALCPANKQFHCIGLPDFPEGKKISENGNHREGTGNHACVPTDHSKIGKALTHVLAWATHGSIWLVEGSPSVYELPRMIHFPSKEGEKIDPKVYDNESCPVTIKPDCAEILEDTCPLGDNANCELTPKRKK